MKQKHVRVTTVLDYVESKWKEYWWRKVGFEAADKISKESAEFGTRVHKLVENNLINLDIIYQDTAEWLCAEKILNYTNDNKIVPLFESYDNSLEIEVKDDKLGLIGHFDYAALVDGQPCIVDFKTSNQMRKSFPLQKVAYAYMANKMFNANIDKGLTIRSHWNKEKEEVEFEVKYYDNLIKKYWPRFKACYDVWQYFNRTEK